MSPLEAMNDLGVFANSLFAVTLDIPIADFVFSASQLALTKADNLCNGCEVRSRPY